MSENQKLQQFFSNFLLIVSRVFSFIFDQTVFVFHDLGEAHKPCMHFSRIFSGSLDRIISWEFNIISFEVEICLHFLLLPLVPSNGFCRFQDRRYSSMPDSCYLARKIVWLFLKFARTFKSTCSKLIEKAESKMLSLKCLACSKRPSRFAVFVPFPQCWGNLYTRLSRVRLKTARAQDYFVVNTAINGKKSRQKVGMKWSSWCAWQPNER